VISTRLPPARAAVIADTRSGRVPSSPTGAGAGGAEAAAGAAGPTHGVDAAAGPNSATVTATAADTATATTRFRVARRPRERPPADRV
jgi:hypothetical protein